MDDHNYVRQVILDKANRSYAINHKITEKYNSESWINQKCFIIAGGESLAGFDFNVLNEYNTIGINRTFQYYPKLKINYSMDSDFYNAVLDGRYDVEGKPKVKDAWVKFAGSRVFLSPMELKKYGDEVFLIKRIHRPSISRDINQGIFGGANSAVGALMLSIVLGSNPIYLLGYDMKVSTKSHWHDGYPNRNLKDFANKLTSYRDEINRLVSLINELGVDIYNLNPDSALRCFPFADLNKVLKEQHADISQCK
jgi:hypothetical protein